MSPAVFTLHKLTLAQTSTPMQFSSPLTAPATSPARPSSPDAPRGTKRKIFSAPEPPAPQTPSKRVPAVIDLCTPSPAAEKVYDLLGLAKRRPLAEVAVPNVGDGAKVEEKEGKEGKGKERGNFEGYLALCRMTRQASQRSGIRKAVVSEESVPVGEVAAETEEAAKKTESVEEKERRLAAMKQRNARAVMARSTGAAVSRGLPPGKGFIRPGTMDSGALVDTLPALRTQYMQSFVSHMTDDVHHVEPNPDHNGFRVRDWSPVYACAYSNGTFSVPLKGVG